LDEGRPEMKQAPAECLIRLKRFARGRAFRVTSGSGGKHNEGSLHYLWRAVDVSVRGKSEGEIQSFIRQARTAGYRVIEERRRPPEQKVWGGAHLHVEDRRDWAGPFWQIDGVYVD
jgi:hypothetical protein